MSLFKTTSEVKKYVNIDVATKFDKLKPSIDDAALRFVQPLLGEALYSELTQAYAAAAQVTDLSADHQELLPYAQKALAFYAAYLFIDEIDIQIGDLGVRQQFNQNSQPAPMAKVAILKLKYITTADSAVELLLSFLEKNAGPAKFGSWYSDAIANTKMEGLIVYNVAIASRHIDINESRRVYLRLKKRIRDIEGNYIKGIIGQEQYAEIVTQIQTGSLTENNKKLCAVLEPIISKQALYLALPYLPISVEADGIYIFSSNDSVTQKQMAGVEEKDRLYKNIREGLSGYESDEAMLHKFLKDNIGNYPLVSASSAWTNNPEDGSFKPIPTNSKCNKFFTT